LKELTYHTVR